MNFHIKLELYNLSKHFLSIQYSTMYDIDNSDNTVQ